MSQKKNLLVNGNGGTIITGAYNELRGARAAPSTAWDEELRDSSQVIEVVGRRREDGL